MQNNLQLEVQPEDAGCTRHGSNRVSNLIVFVCVVAAVLVVDRATKAFFDTAEVGYSFDGAGILGIVNFILVHNTGGAWGIFSGNTFALGIVAVVFCAFAILYLFVIAPDSSKLACVALALLVGGGVGNMIDRFAAGYVVDFLHFTFVDFPVFNVADIGVTCGVVLFLLSVVLDYVKESKQLKREFEQDA